MVKLTIILFLFHAISSAFAESRESTRYLLYDVNPVEGFNLRRDVYMRMANLVKLMRQKDVSWTLVLPPFTTLYHWRSVVDQEKLPWSYFFDVASMAKHVPVIEFVEFLDIAKQKLKTKTEVMTVIDEYYQLQQDQEFFRTGVWKEGVFPTSDCNDGQEVRLIGGVYRGLFYGYTDLAAAKFSCLTASADIEVFSNWISSATTANVVMLGRAEVLIHGKYSEWSEEWWTARRSMRYAAHLVDIATSFRSQSLDSNDKDDGTILPDDWQEEKPSSSATGGPYLCAHWRRADYVLSYPEKSPGPGATARQLKKLAQATSLSNIYVSTDTNDMEVLRLTKLLEPDDIKIIRYKPDRPTLIKIKDGGQAIVDQIICSHARWFVGSYSSTFSFRIQEDRMIMGFSPESTFNRLCGDNETECEQPTKWKIIYPVPVPVKKSTEKSPSGHEEL